MDRLTVEQVLFSHSRLIDETGGSHGVRDLRLLESAVARPFATFGGEDPHPGVCWKAAALFDGIVRNHPFVDGNKRTAIGSAALFLERNGRRLVASNRELERFSLRAADVHLSLEEIADWLKSNTKPVGGK